MHLVTVRGMSVTIVSSMEILPSMCGISESSWSYLQQPQQIGKKKIVSYQTAAVTIILINITLEPIVWDSCRLKAVLQSEGKWCQKFLNKIVSPFIK